MVSRGRYKTSPAVSLQSSDEKVWRGHRNAPQPITEALERQLLKRDGKPKFEERTQKQHWVGWLGDYNGPGYYNRARWDRTPAYIYNHINCAPMLLWLVEAEGMSRHLVDKAVEAVMTAKPNGPSQCAALRKVIPWSSVARALG